MDSRSVKRRELGQTSVTLRKDIRAQLAMCDRETKLSLDMQRDVTEYINRCSIFLNNHVDFAGDQ